MTATMARLQRLRTADVAVVLFVLSEAFGWYVGLRAIGTMMARDGFTVLAANIEQFAGNTPFEPARIQLALAVARNAAAHATSGPPLIAVLLAAGGAFLLVRWLVALRMEVALSAVLGVAVSLLAYQVLLRISIQHDLRIWESAGLVRLLGVGDAGQAAEADVRTFLARPSASAPIREPLTAIVTGLALIWLRFGYIARGSFQYDRVLRSFGVMFAGLLFVQACAGVVQGVNVLGLFLGYFVFAALALAVAHAARAEEAAGSLSRRAPWLLSLGVTLGAVAAVACVFGLLALMDAGRVFAPVVSFAMHIIGRVLWLVLYPFAVIMDWGMNLIMGGKTLKLDQMIQNLKEMEPPHNDNANNPGIPAWVTTGFRTLALLASAWLLYRLGRVLFAARRRFTPTAGYEEIRGDATGELPGAGFLGGLFRRRPGAPDNGWLQRHAVYELFARVVHDARVRGVERDPGDTPIEFARDASERLVAEPFQPVADAFDRARYGRHFPGEAEVTALNGALTEWERVHPGPESGAAP